MVSAKGKEKVTDDSGKGKRKWGSRGGGDDDKTGRKRKNRGGGIFIEDAAEVDEDDSEEEVEDDWDADSSGYVSEMFENEDGSGFKVNKEPGKSSHIPFVKEEEMSEDEFDRMMEARYKPGSSLVTYAEDGSDHQKSIDRAIFVPSAKDPTIWKVKCMVGRERYSALCLMQKYADVTSLGNKMQIISACSLDHVKGFIIIEAEKQFDIYEACKGLSTIYSSKATAVPSKEISRLLSIRSKSCAIAEGHWARVKNGRYKGDLAQVVSVDDKRKKVTVKLIPRIDLKSMAEKFGGGIPVKRTAVPAQRLITPSELEEFRPLIQIRRDRDTNLIFEVLDGMMLKDGYLYKKIAMDSLSFWGIVPTEDELLKFEPANKDGSTDEQWLTQLFGEKKKKEVIRSKPDKGCGKSVGGKSEGGKSEGSSSANCEYNFELHDLVFFGRKDFGVVIGSDKDDTVKVIKEGPEGPLVVNVKQSDLKIASFDKKLFTVLDHHSNTLTANNEVRVMDGPLKGRQGFIKKIYKGILFLHDESELENSGYICIKSTQCEKINLPGDVPTEQNGEPVSSEFADLTSSPKSPLSPDKSLQEMDNKGNSARDDNGMFSVGQSLRIRIGPLKGYICRVLAVRRSDVTVKLDSKHKIITVKSEHLSEVRGRNPAITQGEDSGSVKPFDFLGGQDSSRDWMDGAALSSEDNKWNAGVSTERSSWSSVPSSDASLLKESGSGDHEDDDPKKEDSAWGAKVTPNQSSSWGAAAANTGWGKPAELQPVGSGESLKDDSWGKAADKWNSGSDTSASKAVWGQSGVSSDQPETSTWKKDFVGSESGAWGSAGGTSNVDAVGWAVSAADKQDSKSSWGKSEGTTSWGKQDGGSSWGKKDDASNQAGGWGSNQTGGGGNSGDDKWDTSLSTKSEVSAWNEGSNANKDGGVQGWGGTNPEGESKSSGWNVSKDSKSSGSSGWGKSSNANEQDGAAGSESFSSWDKQQKPNENKQSSWNERSNANKDGGGQGWGGTNPEGESKSSGWNVSKDSNSSGSSGWGKSSNASEQDGAAGSGFSSWEKQQKPNENNQSSWNASTISLDGNQSSGWSKESNWGSQKASEDKGGWKSKEGSSTGWGQGNWSKSGTSETGGNQDSTWSSKGNWNSGGGFNDSNDQDYSGRGGRGGSWRGRGGRGDRGGFRGRGGSDSGDFGGRGDRGGFRGRGGSDNGDFGGRGGRGRFGGRGYDRGGYGGRGGSDGEGFRGSGGFRGRGRGDWNNREDNSNQDRFSSWGTGSNNDGGGWKSSGNASSWKQSEDENGGSSTWKQQKDNASRGGSWSQKGIDNNQSQGWNSSWSQSNKDSNKNAGGSGWGQPSADKETSNWGQPSRSQKGNDNSQSQGWNSSWSQSNKDSNKEAGGSGWGQASADKEKSSWNKNNPESNDRTSSAKAAGSSWGAPPVNSESSVSWNKSEITDGVQTNALAKDEQPSDPWGKAATSSWGAPSENSNSSRSWSKKPDPIDGAPTSASTKDEGPSDAWGKAAASAWGSGSGKGGW